MRLDDAARHAALATLACFALAFAAGGLAYALLGIHPSYPAAPSSGPLGEVFGATAFRWDSTWYLRIAEQGYSDVEFAFFPLYPMLMRGLGGVLGSPAAAGLLISGIATYAAFLLLHRLTTLELGDAAAARAVWILALFPTAVFLPAVMTEALFLALSVGAVYAARLERWGWAAALGAAAALTRNTGVLLIVPIALLYLYGPRGEPGRLPPRRQWASRFRVRPNLALLLLIPAALAGFLAYGWWVTGDPLATLHAQGHEWERDVGLPLAATWLAGGDALRAIGDLAGGAVDLGGALSYGSPAYAALRSLREVAWLAFAAVALVLAFRRLPRPYGVYAGLAMVLPLSAPAPDDPLVSFSRYLLVLFPLQMALAGWASTGRRLTAVLAPSAALFVLYAAELANGRWV